MRKLELKKLQDPRIAKLTADIRGRYQTEGCSEALIENLIELREVYIELEQPSIVKCIRLACEHIDKYQDFVLPYWGNDAFEEDNNENNDETKSEKQGQKIDLSASMGPSFLYFLDLVANPSNKYNRDEIKEINILLKDSLKNDTTNQEEEEANED